MGLRDWIVDRYWALREACTHADIYNAYRAAGHPTPLLAANEEIFIRAHYLERFRDYASDGFLEEGLELKDAKVNFIEENLSGKYAVLDRATTLKVRAVILNMPADEAYHKPAYKKWCDEIDAFAEECRQEVAERERLNGPDLLVRRVLRGRA